MTSVGDAREVGWYSWEEWHHVRKLLYSYNDTKSQIKGINMVRVWKSRLSHRALPVSVDLTAALVAAYVGNATCCYGNEYETQMSSAMAIIRFVNGVTDQHQTGLYAQSVQLIADKINIPDWMVDLRHEATHAKLPGFDLLKSGLVIALNWLDSNYWEETAIKLIEKEQTFSVNLNKQLGDYADSIIDILTLDFNIKCNHKGVKEKNKIRQRKMTVLDDTNNAIVKCIHPGNLRQFISTLLQNGFFVLNQKQLQLLQLSIVNYDYELDKTSIDRLIDFSNLWKPLFDKIQEAIPSFIELFIYEIINMEKKNQTSNACVNYIIVMYVVFQCNKTCGRHILSYLLKNPSHLAFQIMKVIVEEGEFSDDIRKKIILFLEIFKPVLNAFTSKSESFDIRKLDILATEAALRGKEIINNFKEASGKFAICNDNFSESWSRRYDISSLPSMGEFPAKENLFYLDTDYCSMDISCEKNISDNANIFMEDNDFKDDIKLKEAIDNLFLDNTVFTGGNDVSPSTTEEYRCDDNAVWDEDVDFNIQDKDYIKHSLGSNFFFSHSKNISDCDTSKIYFF